MTTLDLVIISGSGGACPSQIEKQNALLMLRNNISSILSNASLVPECGDGLWYRVANLNMTDPTQQCPSAWRLYNTSGVRACGRPATTGPSCPATFYQTGRQYSKVCGRIIGYQKGSPDAFNIIPPLVNSLDNYYMDGISITHGNLTSHIWTYAAGVTEGTDLSNPTPDCPCVSIEAAKEPDYIGNNYYCESGNSASSYTFDLLYSSDPLWDGQQCEGQCCRNGKSPPWFSVEISNTTTDDIEVRVCGDEGTSNEDTPIQLMEIYVS